MKQYVKDEKGKYKLVDKKDEPENEKVKAWVQEVMEGPKLKELEARVRRLESIVIDPRK